MSESDKLDDRWSGYLPDRDIYNEYGLDKDYNLEWLSNIAHDYLIIKMYVRYCISNIPKDIINIILDYIYVFPEQVYRDRI